MKCLYPRLKVTNAQNITIDCGRCMPCRIRKREDWTGRIVLESLCHPVSTFVTLTYSNEHLPKFGWLRRDDVTLFLKRLRKRVAPQKIWYFFVGEYGSQTDRPHYHAVLFGLGEDKWGDVDASWGLGFSSCSELTLPRARYVARYTIKKMTSATSWPDGRSPEFATMSRRPGLGATLARKIGQELMQKVGSVAEVPHKVRIGDRHVKLDRYMRNAVMEILGNGETRKQVSQYQAHVRAPERIATAPTVGEAELVEAALRDELARKDRRSARRSACSDFQERCQSKTGSGSSGTDRQLPSSPDARRTNTDSPRDAPSEISRSRQQDQTLG